MIVEDKSLVNMAIRSITVDEDYINYIRFNGEVAYVKIPKIVPNYNEEDESKYSFVTNKPTYGNISESDDLNIGSTVEHNDGSLTIKTEYGYKKIRASKDEVGRTIKFNKFKVGNFYAKGTIVYSNNNLFIARISGMKYRDPDMDSYHWKKLIHNNMFRIIQRNKGFSILGTIIALDSVDDLTLNVLTIFDLCVASEVSTEEEILEIKEFISNDENGLFSTIPKPRESDISFTFYGKNSFTCIIEYSSVFPNDFGGISVIGYDENNNILYENSIKVPEGSTTMNHIEKHRTSSFDEFTIVSEQSGLSTKTSTVLIQNSNIKSIILTLSHSRYNDRDTKFTPFVKFRNLSMN